MFDSDAQQSRSTIQVLLGFLLGIVASLLCLFLAIFLGSTLRTRHTWLFPLFNAIGLVLLGIVAAKNARQSGYAAGAVIALSLALLLDGVCAAVILKGS